MVTGYINNWFLHPFDPLLHSFCSKGNMSLLSMKVYILSVKMDVHTLYLVERQVVGLVLSLIFWSCKKIGSSLWQPALWFFFQVLLWFLRFAFSLMRASLYKGGNYFCNLAIKVGLKYFSRIRGFGLNGGLFRKGGILCLYIRSW